MKSLIEKLKACLIVSVAALGGLALPGCTAAQLAETGNIAADTVNLVEQGAATYVAAQAALSGAQQTMGGHGVSLSNIGAYASAIATPANKSDQLHKPRRAILSGNRTAYHADGKARADHPVNSSNLERWRKI